MTKRVLGISPLPVHFVGAVCYRDRWDEIQIVSRGMITRALEEAAKDPTPGQVTIFLDGFEPRANPRKALQVLSRKKVPVTWVASRANAWLQPVCAGLPGVELVEKPLQDFLEREELLDPQAKAMFKALESRNGEFLDFLRYKISLILMAERDPRVLREAIDQIVLFKTQKWLRLADFPAPDQGAVRQFRELDFPYIEGYSAPLRDLKRRIKQVGATDLSVLILGSTGTGKEAAAFYLHDYSGRRGKPYHAFNCAGYEKDLLLAELFGSKKGAFTGAIDRRGLVEDADGGTLFLDEIGDMSLSVQAALLRFLEGKQFRRMGETTVRQADIRIIAAGQPSLKTKMERGEFRGDLFYRLAQVEMRTPDLAAIRDDIKWVIRHLLYKWYPRSQETGSIYHRYDAVMKDFEKNQDILAHYPWPGNVRELVALVRRTAELGDPAFTELAQRIKDGEAPIGPLDPNGLFSHLPPGQILPLDEVKRLYIRTIGEKNPGLSKKDLGKNLGLAFNTLAKFLD